MTHRIRSNISSATSNAGLANLDASNARSGAESALLKSGFLRKVESVDEKTQFKKMDYVAPRPVTPAPSKP